MKTTLLAAAALLATVQGAVIQERQRPVTSRPAGGRDGTEPSPPWFTEGPTSRTPWFSLGPPSVSTTFWPNDPSGGRGTTQGQSTLPKKTS